MVHGFVVELESVHTYIVEGAICLALVVYPKICSALLGLVEHVSELPWRDRLVDNPDDCGSVGFEVIESLAIRVLGSAIIQLSPLACDTLSYTFSNSFGVKRAKCVLNWTPIGNREKAAILTIRPISVDR